MSERSWLARVRHVKELGPWTQTPGEAKSADDEQDFERLIQHWARNAPLRDEFRYAFQTGLHGSRIFRHERDADYRLFVGCRWAEDLDRALRKRSGDQGFAFHPYELRFHQTHFVRWAFPSPSGHLRFWRPDWEQSEILGRSADLMQDWFYTQHDRVQWVVSAFPGQPTPTDHLVYGMVDCEEVSVADHREAKLVETWGVQVLPLWHQLLAIPAERRHVSLVSFDDFR